MPYNAKKRGYRAGHAFLLPREREAHGSEAALRRVLVSVSFRAWRSH